MYDGHTSERSNIMNVKKGLLITAIIWLICASMAVTALAEPIYGTCENSSVSYTISDSGTLTVSGVGSIPDYPDNDSPWFEHSESITEIIIDGNISTIGEGAFLGISAVVIISDTVSYIGQYAFGYSKNGSEYIKIDDFTIIGAAGSSAESYASSNGFNFLTSDPPSTEAPETSSPSTDAPETSAPGSDAQNKEGICGDGVMYSLSASGVLTIKGNGAIYNYDSESSPWERYKSGDGDYVITKIIIEDGVTAIGKNAFSGCTSLTEVIMTSVETIESGAFKNCSALSYIKLPSCLKTVSDYAFSYCTLLTEAVLPQGVYVIGSHAFEFSGLTKVTVPSSVTEMGENAFYFCSSLTEANVNSTIIPKRGFSGCYSLSALTLGDNLISIGDYAFVNCSSLTTVSFPERLEAVGIEAFDGCTQLTDVDFKSNVSSFGTYAFKNCSSLLSFSFSDLVNEVPEGMFYGCSSLSSITLGDGISKIGDYAFTNCTSLTNIFISHKVKYIGSYSLGYTEDAGSFYPVLPDSFKIEGFTPSAAENYAKTNGFEFVPYKEIDSDSGNLTESITWEFTPDTGLLSIIGHGIMPDFTSFDESPWYMYRDIIESVTISYGIVNVGSNSFNGCAYLENVELPETIERIGASAFSGSGLTELILPLGLKSIESEAFSNCYFLEMVILPSSLERIGDSAFKAAALLRTISVPPSVVEIGAFAIGFSENDKVIPDFVIKAPEGSIAKLFADSNGIGFTVAGFVTVSDSNEQCTVIVPSDTEIGFSLIFDKDLTPLKPEILLPADRAYVVYNASLLLDGAEYSPDGNLTLSVLIPDELIIGNVTVYKLDENGNFVLINSTVTNGTVTFECSSLGTFVLSTADLSSLRYITVSYKYSNGTTAFESYVLRAVQGAEYSIKAVDLDGYTLNNKVSAGTVDSDDIDISFVYTEIVQAPASSDDSENTDNQSKSNGTKILLIIMLIVLLIALVAAIILLIFLNYKKNRKQRERNRTINAAAKKKTKHDAMAETIIVPDFATREIDIKSLFADEPEEDVIAEEELKKKIDSLKNN